MEYFAVMIECTNLLVRLNEQEKLTSVGCFCTRYVSDVDEGVAVAKAKKSVQVELAEQGIECELEQIEIESVDRIDSLPLEGELKGQGFTFYES